VEFQILASDGDFVLVDSGANTLGSDPSEDSRASGG